MSRWQSHMDEQGLFGIRARALTMATLGTLIATCATVRCPGADAPADRHNLLEAKPEAIEAWQDLRFGMFVCWGPVSLTGLEIGWSRGAARTNQSQGGKGPTPVEVYDNLYKQWKPDKFDARAWVKVAQDAGAKYMIFLVKHHDGYCLYDTKLADYKSTAPQAAWQRDVMKDIAEACHAADLKLIPYYSQPDWHHPDYRTVSHARYIEYLHGQVRELLTGYGQLDGLWFDGLGGRAADWDAENLFRMARELQPHLVINNRCGLPGDYDTPEQTLGRFQLDRPWETCMTLGTQWSWKPDDKIKSLKECVDALVICAVRGGNLALNTGPMPDGQIEPRQAERFAELGRWLRKYGQSIYGTRGGPFRSAAWGGITHRENTIFVHVLNWPIREVNLPAISKRIVRSSVLTGGSATVQPSGSGVEIVVPPSDRQGLDTIIALTLDGPASELRLLATSSSQGKHVKASSVWGSSYEAEMAFDGNANTRWGAAPGAHEGWLEVDLGAPTTVNRAVIDEGNWNRVRQFELQCLEDGAWRTISSGTTIGSDRELTFAPVKGQVFRLNISKADDVPTICEFELFEAK
jgi:alpha-L-fucosidase